MKPNVTVNILPPSFEPWECYSVEQLQAIVRAWQWILVQPGWSDWQKFGETCIAEIQAELEERDRSHE